MDEPVDPKAVKRALRALAAGETPAWTDSGEGDDDWAAPIRDAADAFERIHAAAEFVEREGLPRLRAAVERAEREGRYETARTGQRALATVERFRRAARTER